MEQPKRKIELEITIGADSWEEVSSILTELSIRAETPIGLIVSGGYSSHYTCKGTVNEFQTGENFRNQLCKYIQHKMLPSEEDQQ